MTPHQTSRERDSNGFPMCPGVLRHNHCLWKYAQSDKPRRMMVRARGSRPSVAFLQSGNVFGKNETDRMNRWRSEKKAYFGLISPQTIVTTANICREYTESSMQRSDVWLQTVTSV